MNIKWDETNKEMITLLYNEGKDDKEIANYFNTSIYAVSKQRSVLGLTSFNKKKHKRKEKQIVLQKECNSFIAHYKENEANHFADLGSNELKAKQMAHQILCAKKLKEITILKPYSKLILQNVIEVKL